MVYKIMMTGWTLTYFFITFIGNVFSYDIIVKNGKLFPWELIIMGKILF